MEHLNWGYIQLGLVAVVFGGLQVWWISSVVRRRDLARPQSDGEDRREYWGIGASVYLTKLQKFRNTKSDFNN